MSEKQCREKLLSRKNRGSLIAFCFLGISIVMIPENCATAETVITGHEVGERVVYRAYFSDIKKARAIAHAEFESLESKYELGYVVVKANAKESYLLRARGFRLVEDANWLAKQREQNTLDANSMTENKNVVATFAGIPGYTCYPRVEEVGTEADALIAAKPSLASWVTIGQSWQKTQNSGGYDLRVLKITNSATTGVNGVKPKLFLQAGIHAREYATTPLALEFAKKLINGYGTDADMTWIIDHHEIHLLLVTNPDGRKKAETGLLWRKNTNTNYCGANSNSRGADLNRNFTFGWFSTSAGSSGDACSDTYRGPSAGSEPEVKAIQAYTKTLWTDRRGPNRTDAAPSDTSGIHLDIHSHGRLLLYPWGSNGTAAGNEKQLATLARKFAYFNAHTPERSNELYETDGTSDGPSYGELGVAAFTFELGTAFFESCSYYSNTILPGNMPALVYAAKVVRTPYLTPSGPDSNAVTVTKSGTTVTLKASFDDTRFNNTNGTEVTQTVAGAEYYIDTPPWVAGAVAVPMTAVDGSFNSGVEAAQASINTSAWSAGKHTLFVRGKDSLGNWGVVSAVFVSIGASTGPTAAFGTAITGKTVVFTDQSTDDGSIASASWNFGDGSSGTGSSVSHNYTSAGTYSVVLTVVDNDGNANSVTKSVTVTDGGIVALTKDVPVTYSGAIGTSKTYTFVVPAGAKNLGFKMSGGTGDGDLYTQLGTAPTTTSFLAKSDGSTNAENIAIAAPVAGMYYLLVNSYAAVNGASIVATYQTIVATELSSGVSVAVNLALNTSKLYSIVVPAGKSSLSITLSGGTGDGDLYARMTSEPTTTSFTQKSDGSTNTETITFNAPAAGTYYILVNAYAAVNNANLKATIN